MFGPPVKIRKTTMIIIAGIANDGHRERAINVDNMIGTPKNICLKLISMIFADQA